MAGLTEEAALQLLNFAQPLNLAVLDAVVGMMHSGPPVQVKFANDILSRFKADPQVWVRCHEILDSSCQDATKFFALQILADLIKTEWRVLASEQTEGIKNFIVSAVIKLSESFSTLEAQSTLVTKLNMVLIEILKHEWPAKWPTFISDIVDSSKTSESLCFNNMGILKLLSEEVFDFSKGQMTQMKVRNLKLTLCQEFSSIFGLCQFVMTNSANGPLLVTTLACLEQFLDWIPIAYIIEYDLIPTLCYKFLNVPLFRNITLKCLTAIASLKAEGQPEVDTALLLMFQHTMSQIRQMIAPGTNLREEFGKGGEDAKEFILNLSLFLSKFLRERGSLLEQQLQTDLLEALEYLCLISDVEDNEIFKICLEYWNYIADSLYHDGSTPGVVDASGGFLGGGLLLQQSQTSPRRMLYAGILQKVREIMVSRMAKPEEVLVVEDADGQVIREKLKDTDSIEQYKFMRETLVYLTNLDCASTELIMTNKLERQCDRTEYSWKALNTLCWAIGSISGTMTDEDEKKFLVIVIRKLLELCEVQKGKDHKAIIASNIMYVVGQYPRFLRQHWRFLQTVINKLFEFMHELHEGVQDMACDTFIKIAQKCRRHFVLVQPQESVPFVEEILRKMQSTIYDLQPHQVETFYEAVGYMVEAQKIPEIRTSLIDMLMQTPNAQWALTIQQARMNPASLTQLATIESLSNIIKQNVRACSSIGHDFIAQLGNIFMDMLLVYKTLSEHISGSFSSSARLEQNVIKHMRIVKKDILKLIGLWISKSEDPATVMSNVIPSLFEAVLQDYQMCHPEAREAEVLGMMATIINKLQGHITVHAIAIFTQIFEPTLDMIKNDFEVFPEHRATFYQLLLALVTHNFSAFMGSSDGQFDLLINAIVWGFKHPIRSVAENGLLIMKELLTNVAQDFTFSQMFFQRFYLQILQYIFEVATDSTHYCELNLHAAILAQMFTYIESGILQAPLSTENPSLTNQVFVQQFVMTLLGKAFPHLQSQQLLVTVEGFFAHNQNPEGFKEHLRDFIVECKEVAGDTASLFLMERQAESEKAQQEKYARQASYAQIPGMLNPHSAVLSNSRGFDDDE